MKKNTTEITLANANSLLRKGAYFEAIEQYEALIEADHSLGIFLNTNIDYAKRKISLDKKLSFLKSQDPNIEIATDIFIGIAAIPDRAQALEQTINSLLPQATKIGVYLNGWKNIPDFLINDKILIAGLNGEDIGDVGKFHWVDDHNGVYFSCDDDLIYPSDYIKKTITKLKEFNFKAAFGWHGSLLIEPFENYYDEKSRRVFLFSAHRPFDTPVHILGTGCVAFHTRYLKIKKSDFQHPNMADIFFSIKGQEQKIPFYVIAHEKNSIVEYEGTKDNSIYAHSHSNSDSKKNTHKLQNEHVTNYRPWVINTFKPLSLLIIGRFDSYSKGGIYKSCNLIKDYLIKAGHNVKVLDTQKKLSEEMVEQFDLCWIYPGDPERPDFLTVDEKIHFIRSKNIPIIVNLSYLYEPNRSHWIRKKIIDLNTGPGAAVLGAFFTETAANDPILSDISNYLCVVPKTIFPTPYNEYITFEDREGICLGDATKLGSTQIIGGKIHPWVEAIHKRLPHVNLYAFKQYAGENPHPKIKYIPHMKESFGEWLAHRRIFICANVHLTFEMVACEVQNYGTPVVYRHMPHSLSEYISATGLAVRSPDEMGEAVAWLYNNEIAWNKLSNASIFRGKSNHIDLMDSSLEGYLRLALHRANSIVKK